MKDETIPPQRQKTTKLLMSHEAISSNGLISSGFFAVVDDLNSLIHLIYHPVPATIYKNNGIILWAAGTYRVVQHRWMHNAGNVCSQSSVFLFKYNKTPTPTMGTHTHS